MKWVSLDEWCGWWTGSEPKDAADTQHREHSKHWKQVPEALWNELQDLQRRLSDVQRRIDELP